MTLKQLAKLAGVSVSTVSRVLNKNDPLAAGSKTRERIWEIARKTNYIPNRSAQLLQRGEVQRAGYTLACIFARSEKACLDPFFSEIYRSVQQRCLQRHLAITQTYTAGEFQYRYNRNERLHFDGALILGRYPKILLEQLSSICRNVVYVGLNPVDDRYNHDQVVCDGYNAAKMAVEYLYSIGHRKIGYIGEMLTEARYRGYYDAMLAHDMPVTRTYMIESKQSVEGGHRGAKRLLDCGQVLPTAIFCANDITAVGVMKGLFEEGISVPGDISVIGIDDIALCQNTSPTLTSIAIPKEELGKMGVNILIDRIEGGHRLPLKVEVPFTLSMRQSCTTPCISDK